MNSFASLGSGSRGNASLVRFGGALFLVDCGFPLRRMEAGCVRLGVNPGDITAIFVTHEHSDHISGVAAMANKYAIPVYASHGTLKARGVGFAGRTITPGRPFEVDGVEVTPVTVPHDAREPVQYVFRQGGAKVGVISDLGCVTRHVVDCYRGCQGLLLESNHDLGMLMRGRYPEPLKQRIAGDFGHLSNQQAREFLSTVSNGSLQVAVGHISAENNHPELIEAALHGCRKQVSSLTLATQSGGFGWIDLHAGYATVRQPSANGAELTANT